MLFNFYSSRLLWLQCPTAKIETATTHSGAGHVGSGPGMGLGMGVLPVTILAMEGVLGQGGVFVVITQKLYSSQDSLLMPSDSMYYIKISIIGKYYLALHSRY